MRRTFDQESLRNLETYLGASDTVASTLISIFYHLAHNPEQLHKLRSELESCNIADHDALKSKQHLNAVIYEPLRLHSALPSGGYRDTPPEDGVAVRRDLKDQFNSHPGHLNLVVPPREVQSPDTLR